MKNHKLTFLVLFLFLTSVACNTIGEIRTLLTEESSGNLPTPQAIDEGTPLPLNTGKPPSDETLMVLENTIVPDNDPVDLAERLAHVANIPETVPAPATPLKVGDRRSFYVTDNDTNVSSLHEATLRYVGDIVYFWVEDGVQYNQNDLDRLARTFEDKIVPTDREFFGSEWNPGIDNDPHIYIVYSTGLGSEVAGYFSSADEVHPDARPLHDSNAGEMFMLSADNGDLSDPYTYGVLAHEFQHMIHWYRDLNETSWINEGMSELATLLNDYVHTGFASEYLFDPDLQLNDWPNDEFATTPHYGAGFIFVTYFLSRFGEDATKALVADVANGLESIDDVLTQFAVADSGAPITTDDVVRDWGIANFLADSSVADGRYSYGDYSEALPGTANYTEYLDQCNGSNTRAVHQYGFDYITFACPGQTTLRFEGSTRTGLLPASPYAGDYAFWSNKGDESDMTLTRNFDFTNVSSPMTLTYQTWYDIETDWDYVYLLASTDNGDTWQFLNTPSGTDTNPTGNSYGWGYTGDSGGGEDVSQAEWIQESVDLSQFAGKQVMLRFEYVTDAAVNGEGLMLDDISIPETSYFEDFEAGDGGWDAQGFARIQNVLPQHFQLALITSGPETTVQILSVPDTNVVDIPLDFSSGVDNVTLVVMGSTRFTRQAATYRFSFAQ